jgi:CheY-like chemotaxis protein
MKVMIVDDNANVRAFLREQLARDVADIVECTSGEDALAAYAAVAPDIVLMDIVMGGMDGIETSRHIRATDPAARIMVVTDYDDPDLKARAAEAGVERYFLKENLTPLRRFLHLLANPYLN